MKICMLTTVHSPFDTRIFHKEAKSLAMNNHDVTVIAPYNRDINLLREGIHIETVKKPKKKFLHFVTMYRLFLKGLNQNYDVYQCHEPGSLFVCSILKLIKGKKVVYDIHEHYPELIAENSFFPPIFRNIIYSIVYLSERLLGRFSDYLIVVDDILLNKFKFVNSNIVAINNYPSLGIFDSKKSEYITENENSIVYVGGLTKIRGILETIKAFELVLEIIPDAKLHFVGDFPHLEYKDGVTTYCREQKLDGKVIFYGAVPHNEVYKYVSTASIAVGLLQPNPRYELAIPVKLFEYMAAEKAVIMSNFKYISSLLKKHNCGIAVKPTDIQEIAEAMCWMLNNPSETKIMAINGRKAVEKEYNWKIMEERLIKLYEELG